MAEKRKVYMYDLYGKYIKDFGSVNEASVATGISNRSINNNLAGVNHRAKDKMFSLEKISCLSPYKSTIKRSVKICAVDNCDNKVFVGIYCSKHYTQIRSHGRIMKRTMSEPNEIILKDNYAEVCLYGKDAENPVDKFIIDTDDIKKVSKYIWGYIASKDRPYVLTRPKGKTLYLHRYLMDCTDRKLVIDHINGNVLDNRRCNLRVVTQQGNMRNITRGNPKNYYFSKARQVWCVNLSINDKTVYLGSYNTEDEAKIMAKEAREKYYIIEEF